MVTDAVFVVVCLLSPRASGIEEALRVKVALEEANQFLFRRSLQAKAARKHSKEYRKARERYPSPEY